MIEISFSVLVIIIGFGFFSMFILMGTYAWYGNQDRLTQVVGYVIAVFTLISIPFMIGEIVII